MEMRESAVSKFTNMIWSAVAFKMKLRVFWSYFCFGSFV